MALLREEIRKLRCPIDDGDRFFIPHRLLYELLSREKITNAIKECKDFPPYYLDELVEKIVRGGRRTFAILVLIKGEEGLISRFIESDNFQNSPLDMKLPFSKDVLVSLIPAETVDDFYETQWELAAPIFSEGVMHRYFDSKVRLPYIQSEEMNAEGGFGVMYEIEIHPDHQRFSSLSGPSVSYYDLIYV